MTYQKFFSARIDQRTFENLNRIAEATDRSKGQVIRVLVNRFGPHLLEIERPDLEPESIKEIVTCDIPDHQSTI